jgi:hypothetical protein
MMSFVEIGDEVVVCVTVDSAIGGVDEGVDEDVDVVISVVIDVSTDGVSEVAIALSVGVRRRVVPIIV